MKKFALQRDPILSLMTRDHVPDLVKGYRGPSTRVCVLNVCCNQEANCCIIFELMSPPTHQDCIIAMTRGDFDILGGTWVFATELFRVDPPTDSPSIYLDEHIFV